MELLVDTAVLRDAGRNLQGPFAVTLEGGQTLVVRRILRILPGKRVVGEGTISGQSVLAKLFVSKGGASKRHWQCEKQGIESLRRADLPTPELVHSGRIEGGGYALLTRFIHDADSLINVWPSLGDQPHSHPNIYPLVDKVLRLLARMHQSGLVQDDLHFGNFLLAQNKLFVIDGDTVQDFGRPLVGAEVAKNIARLVAQLPASWDRHLVRLLGSYEAVCGGADLSVDDLRTEVGKERKRRLNDYLAKCARDCTLFYFEKDMLRIVSAWRAALPAIRSVLNAPDAALEGGVRLKSCRTCTVARVDAKDSAFILKRYNLKSLAHAMFRAWRPSRAWHAWQAGNMLDFLGVPTPKPVAVIEERFGLLRRRAFLLTAYCDGRNLLDHLSADSIPGQAEREAIIDVFNSLFEQRISHGDMKASNLIWSEGRLVLIDLDAMVRHVSDAAFRRAWRRDRNRMLANWPEASVLRKWLDEILPQT